MAKVNLMHFHSVENATNSSRKSKIKHENKIIINVMCYYSVFENVTNPSCKSKVKHENKIIISTRCFHLVENVRNLNCLKVK